MALAGEDTLRPELQRDTDQLLSGIGADEEHPFGEGYDLSPSDMEIGRAR